MSGHYFVVFDNATDRVVFYTQDTGRAYQFQQNYGRNLCDTEIRSETDFNKFNLDYAKTDE